MVNPLLNNTHSIVQAISKMNYQLEELQVQLASGKKAQTLSDLGSDRIFYLTLHSRLSALQGYEQTATTVDTRLEFMNLSLERLDELEAEARSVAQLDSLELNGVNLTAAQTNATGQLKEVLDLLNTELNGRYLFAGEKTDSTPVQTYDVIMNGEGARAGYLDVKQERLQADLGTLGLGRLTHSVNTNTVTLSEDGDHPFGFKIGALASITGNAVFTQAAGSPPSASITIANQVQHNEEISLTLNLPDGTSTEVIFKAQTNSSDDPFSFQIGADVNATAANLNAAINTALTHLAQTQLQAASAFAAADMFFPADGEMTQRVSGPPYDSATSLVNATSADTVFWYVGDTSTVPARQTAQVNIDDSTTISYGARANEIGFTQLVRSLAAFSSESYNAQDADSTERYKAANFRLRDRLSEDQNYLQGSLELVTLELGLAQSTLDRTKERQAQYEVSLQNLLSDIDDVNQEEVALKMLTLKTRLEASYQTTSILSRLSLVNYL